MRPLDCCFEDILRPHKGRISPQSYYFLYQNKSGSSKWLQFQFIFLKATKAAENPRSLP